MNVTTPGSDLRLRSSFATLPTATRSRERSRVKASASEMRSPARARSSTGATVVSSAIMLTPQAYPTARARGRGRRLLGRDGLELGEAQLGHGLELAGQVGQLEEPDEPLPLARAE